MSEATRLLKNNKLYYRDNKGGLRNLKKTDIKVYASILDYFLNKKGNDRYVELNKNVKVWSKYEPIITEPFTQEIKDRLNKIFPKQKSAVIYYNGSWKPLINFINLK